MDFEKYKFPQRKSTTERFFNLLNNQIPLKRHVFLARREDSEVTELLHERGTTDMAIGDATAEIMVTTLGPIPNVMYDLEQTTVNTMMKPEESPATTLSVITTITTEQIPTKPIMANHATLFTILTVCLIILLLLSCAIVCIIARRRRYIIASHRDCDPDCDGTKQPLIKCGKFSKSTSRTSSTGNK